MKQENKNKQSGMVFAKSEDMEEEKKLTDAITPISEESRNTSRTKLTMQLKEEITQSLSGIIHEINLFFDCDRRQVLGEIFEKDGFLWLNKPECYIAYFHSLKYPVRCWSLKELPDEWLTRFVKDYVDNERWKDEKKTFEIGGPDDYISNNSLL